MPRKFLNRLLPRPQELRDHAQLRHFGAVLHAPDLWSPTRRSVADALALGLFVGFMPIPFQMPLAAAAAVLLRVNLPVAVMAVWITNPLTITPILYVAHGIGVRILDVPADPVAADTHAGWLWHQTGRVWKPIAIGCLFLGAVSSALGYTAVQLLWRAWVLRLRWRRRSMSQRPSRPPSHPG